MNVVLWSTGKALVTATFLFPDKVSPKPRKDFHYPEQNSVLFREPASRLNKGAWASLRRQIRMILCLLSFLKHHTGHEAAVWGGGSSCGRSQAVKTHLNLVMNTELKVWLQHASLKQLPSAQGSMWIAYWILILEAIRVFRWSAST